MSCHELLQYGAGRGRQLGDRQHAKQRPSSHAAAHASTMAPPRALPALAAARLPPVKAWRPVKGGRHEGPGAGQIGPNYPGSLNTKRAETPRGSAHVPVPARPRERHALPHAANELVPRAAFRRPVAPRFRTQPHEPLQHQASRRACM